MRKVFVSLAIIACCSVTIAQDIAVDPQNPQDLARQVIHAYQSGHAGQVRASLPSYVPVLENALKNQTNDSLIHFALGICNMGQNHGGAALTNFAVAYQNSNHDPSVGLLYALTLKMSRQPLKAYEVDKEMAAAHPDNPQIQVNLAALEMTIQKYDEAVAILEDLKQNEPADLAPGDRSALLLMLGTCYLYQGHHAKAIEALEKAESILPNMAVDLTVLGQAYLKNGDFTKADATLTRALSINPKIPPALYYQGICREKSGDTAGAQIDFQDAYQYGKPRLDDNGENHYLMYLICQKLGKDDEASVHKADAAKLSVTYEAPWKQK